MSWREFVPNFGRGIFYILLSLGHYSNADLAPNETTRGIYGPDLAPNETIRGIYRPDLAPNETIRGIYGERLDILCPLHFPNIAEQQIILYINSQPMIIREFKKTKTPAIHCTSDHPYEKMCQTQMMNSYADKNNMHFVIDKVPETLNGSTSQCGTDHDDFEKKTRRDPPRTIILRERIKGYVNAKITISCPIPNGHREWFVGLKINMTNRAQVWNQSTDDFHCVTGSHYFNVCRNHMNGSSYVNNRTVFFVLENTPACLNNSELHCFAVNFLIHKENDHDPLEKILTLYKDPSTIISTALNREKATTFSEVSPTSTVTVHTTTSTNPVASTKAKRKNLTWLWILLALIIIIIIIIIGFVCLCIVYHHCPDNLPSQGCRNVCQCIWKCCNGEYAATNQSTD